MVTSSSLSSPAGPVSSRVMSAMRVLPRSSHVMAISGVELVVAALVFDGRDPLGGDGLAAGVGRTGQCDDERHHGDDDEARTIARTVAPGRQQPAQKRHAGGSGVRQRWTGGA